MKTIIQITLFLLLIAGCKKEEPETTISGAVVNYGTLKPIDSVLVTVVSGAGSGTFGDTKGSGSEVSAYTDSNGKFSITITGESLFLYMKKTKYLYEEEIFGAYKSYTAGNVYNNEQLKLKAKSYFYGIFYLKDCLTSDSSFIIDGHYLNHDPRLQGLRVYFGKVVESGYPDCIPCSIIAGDTYYKYGVLRQESGIWQPLIIDSVYIKSFETYRDTIYY